MASLEISPAFLTAFITRVFRQTDFINGYTYPNAESGLLPRGNPADPNCFNSNICLMKGTIPTLPNLTNINARSTDVLIYFQSSNTNFTSFSNFASNPVVITTTFTAAAASGAASWFWLNSYWGNSGASTILHQAIGTVGLVGSGADLEMVDTNIVSGTTYQIANLKFQFPTSWTY